MKTGIVKYFNHATGYGFIEEDGTEKLVYVQAKNISEKIEKDDEVVFEIETKAVLNAIKVRKL